MRAGRAPALIVTGGLGRNAPAEAVVMRDLAVQEGVSDRLILVEDQARNTMDSGRLCVSMMRQRGWAHALIVTDDYHIPRTQFIFRWFGVQVAAIAAPGARQGLGTVRWAYYCLREVAAWPWTLLRLIRLGMR